MHPRRSCWTAALMALLPALALAGPGGPKDNPRSETPAEQLRKALEQVRDLDIADQALPIALSQLKDQTKINFVLDSATLMQMGIDPNQWTVGLHLKNVKLRSGLRTMLSPYHLSCAILGDTVLVTTEEMAMFRQLRQRVSLDLDKTPLSQAFRQLSRETATNVLLDTKALKEGEQSFTLQLDDVPLETAVRLLSEMAGLKPVRVGNVLYVTTKANANELRSDPDLAPNPGGVPGTVMPGGAMPGGMVPVLPPGVGGPGAGAGIPAIDTVPGVPDKPAKDEKSLPDEKPPDKKPEAPPDKPK